MAKTSEIREHLASYLAGEVSLDHLDNWLTASTWNIHQAGEPEAERLAYAIELRLAEHSIGHLSFAGLRRELFTFVDRYTATVGAPKLPDVLTTSTGVVLELPLLAVA